MPNAKYPHDDSNWVSPTSDLTWYYNYGSSPSPAFDNTTKLEFVPMLWGAPQDSSDTTFLEDVQSQIKAGTNVSYVLTFNEPDASQNGGSGVSAETAASTWQREVEPLKKQGVKLGAPAVTGAPSGFTWLQNFFTACNGNCSADFIPVHWYGNFEGLASHIGQVRSTYPNMSIWVTEYADANDNLANTQSFYNQSAQYFDRIEYVVRFIVVHAFKWKLTSMSSYITHYSYFGAFRSSYSNVGPNAAMLTQKGKLTSIGSWYLGGVATNNIPSAAPRIGSSFTGLGILVVLSFAFLCFT